MGFVDHRTRRAASLATGGLRLASKPMIERIDPTHFRNVMGQIPTCVTVVTAMVEGEPVAMVIGSFVSVSLDPPLAGFFCTTASETWQQLRGAEVLGGERPVGRPGRHQQRLYART